MVENKRIRLAHHLEGTIVLLERVTLTQKNTHSEKFPTEMEVSKCSYRQRLTTIAIIAIVVSLCYRFDDYLQQFLTLCYVRESIYLK